MVPTCPLCKVGTGNLRVRSDVTRTDRHSYRELELACACANAVDLFWSAPGKDLDVGLELWTEGLALPGSLSSELVSTGYGPNTSSSPTFKSPERRRPPTISGFSTVDRPE